MSHFGKPLMTVKSNAHLFTLPPVLSFRLAVVILGALPSLIWKTGKHVIQQAVVLVPKKTYPRCNHLAMAYIQLEKQ